MTWIYEFVSLLLFSHLIFGVLITFAVGSILSRSRANASTRHSVWLGVLVFLTILPFLSFLSVVNPDDSYFRNRELSIADISSPAEYSVDFTTNSVQQNEAPLIQDNRLQDVAANSSVQAQPEAPLYARVRNILISPPLHSGIGRYLSLLLVLGVICKAGLTISSFRKLKKLIAGSKVASVRYSNILNDHASRFGLKKVPSLKLSSEIQTPLAAGIFSPVILIPEDMLTTEETSGLIDQVLLHELAHVKRKDPLIANLQAVISVLLFWNPAVRYVNNRIRFECEIACDDWVIGLQDENTTRYAKSYASNLVSISESLLGSVPESHSLACVQSTSGLGKRIKLLLDENLNHTTSIAKKQSIAILGLALFMLVSWIPALPQYPVHYSLMGSEEDTFASLTLLENDASMSSSIVQLSESNSEYITSPFSHADMDEANNIPESEQSIEVMALSDNFPPRHTKNEATLLSLDQAIGLEHFSPAIDSAVFYSEISVSTEAVNSESHLTAQLETDLGEANTSLLPLEEGLMESDDIAISNLKLSGNSEIQSLEPRSGSQIVGFENEARFPDLTLDVSENGELLIANKVPIEEITVIAKRSMYSLRTQIRRAEKSLYSVYNQHNEERDFDVHCRKAQLYESLIGSYRCWPRFFEAVVAADSQRNLGHEFPQPAIRFGSYYSTGFSTTSIASLRSQNRHMFSALRDNILAIAEEHPDVSNALVRVATLQQSYQLKRDECMEKPPVFFLVRKCS